MKRTHWKKAATRAKSLANLAQGKYAKDHTFQESKPTITPVLAAQFVKLLSSGFSAPLALDYLFPPNSGRRPRMGGTQLKVWHREWLNSPLVANATSEFNGGEWHNLDHDAQIALALDHLDAQMARFLYTADYNADDAPLGKIADARTALMARIKSRDGDESPWEKAMRDLLEGKIVSGPPQLAAALPVPLPQDLES